MRDTLQWLRGNGFPKNHDMTAAGACRKGYGNSLKPGHDLIILARKTLNGTATQNATKWGCGLLNLDACRIPGTEKSRFPNGTYENGGLFGLGNRRDGQDHHPDSRCPTNVILDEEAACLLDGQEAAQAVSFIAPGQQRRRKTRDCRRA